jgi:hypothetical protein
VFHDPPVGRHQNHHCRRHRNCERQPKSSPTADQQLRVPLLRSGPEQQQQQQQQQQ